MRLKDLQDLQKSQIDAICQNFVKHGEAFYHPITKKLSFIEDGICVKGDCSIRDKKMVSRKILLPIHMRKDFKTEVEGECFLPLENIGKAVVCMTHFFVDHQKSYLQNGILPQEATRLMARHEMFHKEGDIIGPPPVYPVIEEKNKAGVVVLKSFGMRIHGPALKNADWVNSFKLQI